MRADGLVNPGEHGRLADGFLKNTFIQMMPHDLSRERVPGTLGSRKDILPGPFLSGMRVFASQGLWQGNFAISIPQILLVKGLYIRYMNLEGWNERFRQNSGPVFFALAIPDNDLVIAKIDILDA